MEQKIPDNIVDEKHTVLLFSGGRDSSLAFTVLAQQEYKIHLLTFYNGVTVGGNLIEYRISELRTQFPKHLVTWERIPSYGLFKKIALDNIEQDFKKYQINLICLGCKLAMHTKAIIYSMKHKISYLATGNTSYQSDWSEQHPSAISIFSEFCNRYGVKYVNPVYRLIDSENKAKELLSDHGLSPKALEGSCMFGNTFSTATEDRIESYLQEKIPICEEYIAYHALVDESIFFEET